MGSIVFWCRFGGVSGGGVAGDDQEEEEDREEIGVDGSDIFVVE
jgi:hypothetical protein